MTAGYNALSESGPGQKWIVVIAGSDNYLAATINAVNLKNGFRDIETVCRESLACLAPPIRGSFNSTHGLWHSRAGGGAVHSINCRQAPPYSITRSAVASNAGGMSRPSDFAVLRLITSRNFVGCSTGSSSGCVPRKTLST
jgi:hypothetical protein